MPSTLCNYLADEFEFWKVEHVSNCESRAFFEMIEIGVEEGVDLGSKIKDSLLSSSVL